MTQPLMPLWTEDSKILILDQTRLPQERIVVQVETQSKCIMPSVPLWCGAPPP